MTRTIILFLVCLGLCSEATALDMNTRQQFDIPAQKLTTALVEFSRQAAVPVVSSTAEVDGFSSQEVKGTMTLKEALTVLLAATDLTIKITDNGAIAIGRFRTKGANEAAPAIRSADEDPSKIVGSENRRAAGAAVKESVSGENVLEAINVTARRREESAQDVPVSINVLTEAGLLTKDIRTASDLDKNASGIVICCARGSVNFSWVRGVPGVVGYFAEVPVSLNGSALYFDLQNVQVLKGPQGTLFGLSTNGGAILNEPARPGRHFGGYGAVTVGDYGRKTVEGAFDAPVSDTFQIRFGGQYHYVDGYARNISTGDVYGGDQYKIGRISTLWRPTEKFSNYSVLNYSWELARPLGSVNAIPTAINPNGPARLIFGPAIDAYIAEQTALGRYRIVGMSVSGRTFHKAEQINLVDTASYEINDSIMFRAITGIQSIRVNDVSDTDMSPFPIYETSLPNPQLGWTRQYTFEPQIQGTVLDKRLTYTAGAFNRWLIPQSDPPAQYVTVFGGRSGSISKDRQRTNAVYAEGTFKISDQWGTTVGYRYSWDKRNDSLQNVTASGTPAGPVFHQDGNWSAASYRIGLTYQPDTNSLIYLTNSKGYSSGGFNSPNLPASVQSYGPESLNNFELGLKRDWSFGGSELRTNLAAYYGLYNDIQVQVINVTTDPVTGNQSIGLAVENAAKGKISGAEAEFTFIPIRAFELVGNVSYMAAKYTSYVSPDPTDPTGLRTIDNSNLPFLFTPKWKYHLEATLHLPIRETLGDISVTAAYSWQAEVANTARPRSAFPYVYNPPLNNLDANITWRHVLGYSALTTSLIATNVTNFDRVNGQFTAYDTLGLFGYSVAVPRSWAVRVQYDF